MVKNAHQAFTIHYITHDFRLMSKCIGLYEFQEPKTGFAVKAKTTDFITIITRTPDERHFVTDNGSNVKAAYKNDIRVSCAGL